METNLFTHPMRKLYKFQYILPHNWLNPNILKLVFKHVNYAIFVNCTQRLIENWTTLIYN